MEHEHADGRQRRRQYDTRYRHARAGFALTGGGLRCPVSLFLSPVFHRFAHALHAAFASDAASAVCIVAGPSAPLVTAFSHSPSGHVGATTPRPIRPFAPSLPDFSSCRTARPPDFFQLGGLTRTSSSAVISGLLNRTVPSRSDLRRTPVQQGSAAFVTGSATRRGTR
ncbi:hypothetical protein DF046_32435 [Burkholderia cepacia]|nr:hypothetical protein DF046_32435 [Burkholderia cepacia]